ncbi:MAG: agmatine deiminase family protein [Nitrospirales bacterium]|nr:agmatine deiminase family protein [Nitrospirales bacterium]
MNAHHETPAQRGFYMPAEWEAHEATWLAWPHNHTDWPGKMAAIHWVYGEIVRILAPGELVRILINSEDHEQRARRVLDRIGVDSNRVEWIRFPTNRGWTRDFGPMFIKRDQPEPELGIARFRFNAWARYADWEKDDAIPEQVATRFGWQLFPIQVAGQDVVLEGGSIEVNGAGTLLTTEECLLDPSTQVRNPGLGRLDMENILKDAFGVQQVFWLGAGIAGDDTHGHIDDVCRFVNAHTVVVCQEKNTHDVNSRPLAENRERLERMCLVDGRKVEVVPLPMPAPLYFDGRRLPASYANFYIANAAVLVPTFNDPHDRVALGILGELFRDRPVVGISAVDLVWGLGTVHCLTQQQPA